MRKIVKYFFITSLLIILLLTSYGLFQIEYERKYVCEGKATSTINGSDLGTKKLFLSIKKYRWWVFSPKGDGQMAIEELGGMNYDFSFSLWFSANRVHFGDGIYKRVSASMRNTSISETLAN
jgi:hypothetical protein